MGKGLLLERDGRLGVVLTPQGEFKRVPVQQAWQVGEEVTYADAPARPWARWAVFAAAALLILLAPIGWQALVPHAIALVTVDINPSVELAVGKDARVISGRGLNEDGAELLKATGALKGKSSAEAVARLTSKAVELNKLDPASDAGAVVVAVAPARDALDEEMAAQLEAEVQEAAEASLETEAQARGIERKAQVVAVAATAEVRDQANQNGISVGKQALKQEIEEQFPDVKLDVDTLKTTPPAKLVEKVSQQAGVELKLGELIGRGRKQRPFSDRDDDDDRDSDDRGKQDDDKGPPFIRGKQDDDEQDSDDRGKQGDDDKRPPFIRGKQDDDDEKRPSDRGKQDGEKPPPDRGQQDDGDSDDRRPPGRDKQDDGEDDDKRPPGRDKRDGEDDNKRPSDRGKKDDDEGPPSKKNPGSDEAPAGRAKGKEAEQKEREGR